MPHPLGLHHIAVVSRDPARSRDFYQRVLGLSFLGSGPAPLASPSRPDLLTPVPAQFFGDGSGRPGSVITVLDQPDAEQGAPGIGGTHHFALAVADRETLLRWKRRMLDQGIAVNGILDRHYFQSIYVNDPDGTIVELATLGPGWAIDEAPDCLGELHRPPPPEMLNTNRDRARVAAENWPEPVPEITDPMRLKGLHHVTAIGVNIEQTHRFTSEQLGMRRVKRTNNFDDAGSYHWYWGVGDGRPGTLVTYFERKPERERPVRMGAGQVAHYAVATGETTLDPLRETLASLRLPVSQVAEFGPDQLRFRAVATRDPDGQPVVVATARGATSYGRPDPASGRGA
jgi:glyoxalase family protein